MTFGFRQFQENDREAIRKIFNYFVENSFAAYAESPVDGEFIETLIAASRGYPFYVIESQESGVVGFGRLRPFHPLPTFRRTAECTYFILPDYTGQGLGSRLLDRLILDAGSLGIDTLIAGISSLNPVSIAFHHKQGFTECGRFKRVGRKFDQDFDIVYMQKILRNPA